MENAVPDEQALLDAAKRGDADALDRLVSAYAARVYRFGKKMCRDEEDAREVLQDTLLAAARGIRSFRGTSSLSTWLYSIARRACLKRRARPERSAEVPLDVSSEPREPASPERGPEERAEARQIEAALDRAIRSLDPAQREVLLLRDVEGLSAREVAEVVGISVEAVKSRLHRARAAVRERVAPLFGREPAGAPGACPDIVTIFSEELEGELSPEVCRRMEAHVAECPRCEARCDSLKRVLGACAAAPPGEVPADLAASVRRAVGAVERPA